MKDETRMEVDRTTSSRGAQWAGAGSLIALAAQSLLGGGLLSGALGGGAAQGMATYELAKKDSEIALLNAKLETRQEVSEVYALLRQRDQEQDAKTAAIESRVLAMETAAPLREQLVLQKVECLSNSVAQGFKSVDCALGNLAATVGAITQTVVPKSAICPEVMARYNSWTAPTEAAST